MTICVVKKSAVIFTVCLLFVSGSGFGTTENRPESEIWQEDLKLVVVRGWTAEQLNRMTVDFVQKYPDSAEQIADLTVTRSGELEYHLVFPEELHTFYFGSLVLYLHNPVGFDMPAQPVNAVGFARLLSLDKQYEYMKIVFYVPEGRPDVLFGVDETGGITSVTFEENSFQLKIEMSRQMPELVAEIIRSVGLQPDLQ
jgi:hypothetical protein